MINEIINVLFFRKWRFSRISRRIAKIFSSEIAEDILILILKFMNLMLFLDAGYRKNIAGFNGRFFFRDIEGDITVSAIFRKNKMKIKRRAVRDPNVTLIFRDENALYRFLDPGKRDIIRMVLDQDMQFQGNFMYLSKFGYMANHLVLQFTGE